MTEQLQPAAWPASALRPLPWLLTYCAHPASLLALGVLAILLSLLDWVAGLPGSVNSLANLGARLLWGAYFYLVARKAMQGKLRLPSLADYRDTRDALIRPLLRVALATGWYWLLLLAYAWYAGELSAFGGRLPAHPMEFLLDQGALGYALLAVGIIGLPIALLASLVGSGLWEVVDPRYGLRMIRWIPRAYLNTFALLCILALVGLLFDVLASQLTAALPVPIAGPVIRQLIPLWVPLAQARLLGEFVFRNQMYLASSGGDD